MFDKKNPQLWPDLSRFVSSVNKHGGRTWDLSSICLANYRFNEYAGIDNALFKDRTGKQSGVAVVSGSGNGITNPGNPSVLIYDTNMLPRGGILGNATDYQRAPASAEIIPGTNQRILRPFVQKCFDFSNRDVRFLLQQDIKDIDLGEAQGCTFVTRICVSSPVDNNDECVFSISNLSNDWHINLSVLEDASDYTIRAYANAPGQAPADVSNLDYDKWYTVIFSFTPMINGVQGYLKMSVWGLDLGAQVGNNTQGVFSSLNTLTDPMLFVGYGGVGTHPNSTFPINTYDDEWGKDTKISEIAIFRGELEPELIQAIATGWSDVGTPATHTMLFPNFKSGINSPSLKTMQRMNADALRTYPSIARSGDGQRTGTGKTEPFNDEYTLVFSASENIRFPDMLPESAFAHDVYGHLDRSDGEAINHSSLSGPDEGFFISGSWINAPGRIAPGLKNNHQFIFQRHDNVVYGNDNSKNGLMDPIVPFNDSSRPASVEVIHQPATPDSTMLGFDQKLGDRIAIVVDLQTYADTLMGHELGTLKLTGSQVAGGLDERTTVPIDADMNTAISSIAYFNFEHQNWDIVGNIPLPSVRSSQEFINTASLAFGGTTGFAVSPDEEEPLLPLASRGRPTDVFGFPFDKRWSTQPGQTLDMSKYISSPLLLEKMLIIQDMEFFESGDDGLGYVIRDSSDQVNFLPMSSSDVTGSPIVPPERARHDRFNDNLGNDQFYRKAEAKYHPGLMTKDFFSYGRFPLLGGMKGEGGGFPKGALLPSSDNKYSVVSNIAGDADTSLFLNSTTENIQLTAGQTPGGAVFWRCDTFFLMRETKSQVDRRKSIQGPAPTLQIPGGRNWPLSRDPQSKVNNEFPIILSQSISFNNVSDDQIRELITYSQIAHCGYVQSDMESQAHKSGSAWQEVHPIRAGANPYPNYNTATTNQPPPGNKPWVADDNAGLPRGAFAQPGTHLYGQYPWMNLGWDKEWCEENLEMTYGLEVHHTHNNVWPSPHPFHTGSAHPRTGELFPEDSFEGTFRNAAWPKNARYNVIGVADTHLNDPFDTDPGSEWEPTFDPGLGANGKWASVFRDTWVSGSYETGGGSLISNPVRFVSEAEVLTPANMPPPGQVGDMHGATDFHRFGGLNVPGKETKKTLLDSGLRRDLTIQLKEGERFIKLKVADPTPGSLGWCDIHEQEWPDTKSRVNSLNGRTLSITWDRLKPTSAYLVATASRAWDGHVPGRAFLNKPNILNSGTFRVLSDIKNSAKVGVQTGISWTSTYPQTGGELKEKFNYPGPIGWGAYPGDYEGFFEDRTITLPINPPGPLSSMAGFSFPRGGRFIHSIKELSPISPSFRSLGLSSGRSFIRGVTAAIETSQKLTFVPASRGVPSNDDPTMPGGYYGWNGPVGAAHFVQTKKYEPFIDWHSVDDQYDFSRSWHLWIGQLLPYSLGLDTRAWVTYFPDMGNMQQQWGGNDPTGFYPPIADATGSNVNMPAQNKQQPTSPAPPYPIPPYLQNTFPAGPMGGLANTGYQFQQNGGVSGVPTALASHPPFTLPVVEQTKSSLAREYVYSSPYLLFPEDKLVLGFQPAIGGMNPGAPKPVNTPSLPYSTCDRLGYQGLAHNDYYKNISPDGWQNSTPPAGPHWWPSPDAVIEEPSYNLSTPKWGMFANAGLLSSYIMNAARFTGNQNKSNLSEQIRQTILKAGPGKLVLYGTLLRDNKPLASELNQPLVTDAIHEALHYDNPVQDQFLIAQPGEYIGSYLTQYVTGSLFKNPAQAGVAATEGNMNLGINASFNRFVTIADQGEVYWDSVLPNIFDVWSADGAEPYDMVSDSGQHYSALYLQDSSVTPVDPPDYNPNWCRAFPFESRYKDADRMLQDPADNQNRTSQTIQKVTAWSNPIGSTEVDVNVSWLKDTAGKPGITFATATILKAGGFIRRSPSTAAVQSKSTSDKTSAALLFGFARTGGLYFAKQPGGTALQTSFGKAFKALNPIPTGYPTVNPLSLTDGPTWDHPEGVKYGLKNYVWESTKMTFRPDRYGQLRDMLEQRKYSKFFHRGNDEIERGEQDAAVSCIFLDSDGNPVDDPSTTSCQNISTFMTSSIPYFEGVTYREPPPPQFITVNLLTPTLSLT